MRGSMFVCVAALALGACVDEGPGPSPKRMDPGYVGKHLLRTMPPLTDPVNVTLGGKVIYLGAEVDTTRVAPAGPLTIKHYWKVLQPVGPGFRVFTMLRGAPTQPDFMYLPPSEMQRAHGPATWRAGEIIEDEQQVVLRPDWKSPRVEVLVGLIATSAHGTLDRMPAEGPRTSDRAVIARTLEVDLSKAPPPLGTVHVPRARGEITIDGVPTDPGWMNVPVSPDFVTAEGSAESAGKATARLTWDETNLYVFTSVQDPDIQSPFTRHDDELWKADVVEIFIDADANKKGYVELQVNPQNATFDTWYAGTRAGPPRDDSYDSNMVTAVKLNGSASPGDSDTSWEAELAIPWAAVKGKAADMNVRVPPAVGDRWRINVVRGDKKSGAQHVAASSWNRITNADWHAMDRMLTVVFADTLGGVVPGSPADPRATPAPAVPPAPAGAGAGSGSGSGAGSGSGSGS